MILYRLFGERTYSSDIKNKEKIINIFLKNSLQYHSFTIDENDGKVYFSCSLKASRAIIEECDRSNTVIFLEKESGLPNLLRENINRVGIPIGVMISVITVILSGMFVWDIRLDGDDSDFEKTVMELLDEQGLYVGRYIKGIDVDSIENKVLLVSDDISWISLNIHGNVVYVKLRTKLPTDINVKDSAPANVVSSKDGQIERIEAYNGDVCVRVGQHVKKGDILISGIYDSNAVGYRLTRAKGSVICKTVDTLHIEIPLEYEVELPANEKIIYKCVKIFSKAIKLYGNSGFSDNNYVTIYKQEDLILPKGKKLPINVYSVSEKLCTKEKRTRDYNDAVTLAYDELDKRLKEVTSGGAVVIRKNTVCLPYEDRCVLDCELTLLENTAVMEEIIIN